MKHRPTYLIPNVECDSLASKNPCWGDLTICGGDNGNVYIEMDELGTVKLDADQAVTLAYCLNEILEYAKELQNERNDHGTDKG